MHKWFGLNKNWIWNRLSITIWNIKSQQGLTLVNINVLADYILFEISTETFLGLTSLTAGMYVVLENIHETPQVILGQQK